jgi:lipopolysaccharide transport system ATP-binding protein
MPISSDKNLAIRVKNLSKTYTISGGNSKPDSIKALSNINMDIYKGEVIGIIGPNGSGKSTLLKIISEITAPDSGYVDIYGKVASILEVGTGFNPDLSGRKNIYLNARLYGMKKKTVDTKLKKIIELFGFPKFLDIPIKQYSSGMYMRLAFAVVVNIDADIYLFDEVLSVGDAEFRIKALSIIKELINQEKTVCIVTHSTDSIMHITDKMLLLNKGKKVFFGIPRQTILEYKKMRSIFDQEKTNKRFFNESQLKSKKNILDDDGKTSFDLTSFEIYNTENQNKEKLYSEEDIAIIINIEYFSSSDIIMVLLIKDQYETVLVTHPINLTSVKKTTSQKCKIIIPKYSFNASEYIIDVMCVNYDYQFLSGYQNLTHITISEQTKMEVSKMKGYINLPLQVDFDD